MFEIKKLTARDGNIAVAVLSLISGIWEGIAGYFWALAMGFSSDGMQYYGLDLFRKFLYDAAEIVIKITYVGTLLASVLFIIGGLLLMWNRRLRWVTIFGSYITYLVCFSYLWYGVVTMVYHKQANTRYFKIGLLSDILYILIPIVALATLPFVLHLILNREKTHLVK